MPNIEDVLDYSQRKTHPTGLA